MKSIKGWYKNMSIITNGTYLRYFEEITKIPHGSGNEKQLSDYLCRFARERGLKLEQDKYYNVVIYKPASKGYENHKPVALQAHIDMVEESDNEYDFSKGLQIYTEDGFIKAKNTALNLLQTLKRCCHGCHWLILLLISKPLWKPVAS